jgi:hypothetical protein
MLTGRNKTAVFLVTGLLAILPGTAAAHGSPTPGAAVGLGPVATVTGVTVGGGLFGVGAVRRRVSVQSGVRSLVDRLVGPLLALLGLLAIATAVRSTVLPALAGAAVGCLVAGVFQYRTDKGACAGATVGAIGLHRFAEGLAIGALAAADTALGIASALLLAGHASAECLALGGHPALSRQRAVWSVLAVQTAFVGGAVAGLVALDTVVVDLPWLVAGIGGVLAVFGAGLTVEGL